MAGSHEIKLDRFYKHVRDAKAAVAEYLRDKPYLLTNEEDAQNLTKVWTITLTKAVPPDIAAITGDALHNLRSVLDNWVYELSTDKHGKTPRDTGFPILKQKSDWDKGSCCRHDHGSRRIRRVPDPVKTVIETIQPFSADPTWMDHIRHHLRTVHELDIRDKHQSLNLMAAHVEMAWWTQSRPEVELRGRYFQRGLLEPNTPTTFLVLQASAPEDFDVRVDPNVVLEVVVAEPQTQWWEGEVLVEPGTEVGNFLDNVANAVTWVLGFARQELERAAFPPEPTVE